MNFRGSKYPCLYQGLIGNPCETVSSSCNPSDQCREGDKGSREPLAPSLHQGQREHSCAQAKGSHSDLGEIMSGIKYRTAVPFTGRTESGEVRREHKVRNGP